MKTGIDIDLSQTALVLEGGGMRGVFTAGVLDYLMDNRIYFEYTIGVSAGACNGLSYLSNQRGRAHRCNIELLQEYNYIGIKPLLTKKCIMDFDLLFNDFPERIIPFHYDYYFNSSQRFEMVTCNCLTGEAEYLEEKKDKVRLLKIARASSSLPFVCPIVEVDGIPMLDGGISDAIPIRRAFNQGYSKAVVVLTRNKEYRKEENKKHIPSFLYKKYPLLREKIQNRAKEYNQTLDYLSEMESEGNILVIRPKKQISVDRIEKDTDKLCALYEEGYACAAEAFSLGKRFTTPL